MPQRPAATWSNPGPAPAARRVPARAWKAVAVLTGLAACVGAITYAVLWLTPPKAPRLLVATASYDDTQLVPPNAGTAADAQGFIDLNRFAGRGRLRPDTVPYRLSRGGVGEMLARLERAREPAVVAVFAANGGCDAGGPFLIPDDAGPDPAERIRVKAVLDAVAKLPADTRKLLVFDAAGNTSAPVLGQFHNDFARGVRTLDAEIVAVPNLLVFVSTGADQRSWRSPEWGESVFLHHMKTGLAGAADANGDSRLSAAEVIGYTTRHTREWARDRRGALQTPELFPTADGQRRAEETALGIVDKTTSNDPLPAAFEPGANWQHLWELFEQFDRLPTHPTAFAPQQWREYVGWLLRADRLLADGDDTGYACLSKASGLVPLLAAARKLSVSPQTLALPSALGDSSAGSDGLGPVVAKVAQASDADRPAEWEKAKRNDRLALGRALVQWVAGDPFARLRLAPPVVALIAEGFNVVPAELHFLVMLDRDLPHHKDTAAVWPLVRRVLELRLHAERTATGPDAEAVRPWVADHVRTADAFRRMAEDLLFADDPASWTTAGTYAHLAGWLYSQADRTAETVRTARTSWQTAGPRLNGLGEWLAAGDHPRDLLGRMTREELLAEVRAAWDDVHRLGELCNGTPAADRVPTLKTLAKAVADRVGTVERLHRTAVARLLDSRPADEDRAALARWWHAADTLLSVPFADRRRELLVELRRASRQLHVLAGTRPEPLAEPPANEVRERAFDAARRRGLLHLSAVGREAYQFAGGEYDRTAFQIDQFSRQADAPAELIAASDRYAEAVRRLPGVLPTDENGLPVADRFARCSPLPVSDDPAVRLRKLRAEQLLNWQAGRTTSDRWSGGDAAKPYYRHAADVLADDARKLAGRPAVPSPTPASPFPLSVPDPAEVVVTDEPNPRIPLAVNAVESPAVGFVVYRQDRTAFVRATTGVPEPMVVPIPARPPPAATTPAVERTTLTLRGYFRGETTDTRAIVARHPIPHATAVRVSADNAVSVAVRPTPDVRGRFGVGSGHLHFVIDCSGSMGPGDEPAAKADFADACDKLEMVLNEMPRGVAVAVSAFGQRTPGAKTPEDTFATLRQPGEWKGAADTAAVMKQLRALQPWDKSAVTRAALTARAAVPDAAGARAVVLFSDCADNRFTDPEVNAKKVAVKDALRAAFDGGCPMHVVAFPAEKAADAVREEFRTVTTFKPAGLFLTPDQTGRLIDWIRTATAPQVRLKLVGDTSDDLTAGTEAADSWLSPLPRAGRYVLQLPDAKLAQTVELKAGERLLAGLTDEGGLRFTRPNFAAEVPAVSRLKGEVWASAVPRQRLTDAGGLELVALADRAGGIAKVLSPARVGDVWFELAPSTKSAVAVKWTNTTGWPCPAWVLSCPAWPTDAGSPAVPTLSAWWSADEPFAPAATWTAPTDTPLSAVAPFTVKTSDGDVTVTGVSLETHGERVCLVVRLTHPTDNPVYPRVKGTKPDGGEVRFYRDANRVTALFWWADTATAAKGVRGLEFVSVEDAKSQAKAAGTSAVLPPLPAPAVGTPDPPPAPR